MREVTRAVKDRRPGMERVREQQRVEASRATRWISSTTNEALVEAAPLQEDVGGRCRALPTPSALRLPESASRIGPTLDRGAPAPANVWPNAAQNCASPITTGFPSPAASATPDAGTRGQPPERNIGEA